MLEQIDALCDHYGLLLGMPGYQFKSVAYYLITWPLGILFRFTPICLRHYFNIIIGSFLLYAFYGNGKIVIRFSICICSNLYYIWHYVQTKGKRRLTCCIFKFCSFILYSIKRLIQLLQLLFNEYYIFINVTCDQILSKSTIQSFAYCVYDGTRPLASLSEYQKKYRIIEFPSFLEFASYILFYAQTVMGPTCEFRTFQDFIARKGQYKTIPWGVFATLKMILQAFVLNLFFNIRLLLEFWCLQPLNSILKTFCKESGLSQKVSILSWFMAHF